ncbi:MAG TPA: hypothetical protein VGR21_12270 [Cryptosporangiaceae bacterium]|nr:hypothetical protein [Cryptosporangiaceae bacterium]
MSTQTAPPRDTRMAEGPGTHEVPERPERRPANRFRRTAGALLVTLALSVPLAFAVWFSWRDAASDANMARNEQAGVSYLRPLSQLVGTLVDTQSAAVRGSRPNAATITSAVARVNEVDDRLGAQLGVHRSWLTLRDRIGQIQRDTSTGQAAYDRHGEVIDLALDLVARVGDGSELILDPVLDSYYLMDTALLRLPVVMVQSGRYADLVALAAVPEDPPAIRNRNPNQAVLTISQVEQIVAAATARDLAVASANTVDPNLRKSVDAAQGGEAVGGGVVQPLDAFRSATTELSRGAAAALDAPAAAVTSAAAALRAASLRLSSAVLDTLNGLLSERERGYEARQLTVGVALGLGIVAAFVALWLLLPSRSVTEPAEQTEEAAGTREIRRTASGVAQPAAADAMEEIRALLGARDLLRAGELVRVGRAVRPGRRESGGDSQ